MATDKEKRSKKLAAAVTRVRLMVGDAEGAKKMRKWVKKMESYKGKIGNK